MRLFLLSLLTVIGINLSAQTSLQYQAHVPFRVESVEFSAYIADSTFNEDSHINASAFWYIEGVTTPVNNGIINVVLESIPDSVFKNHEQNLFVYGYVNGQTLGKLPVFPVPYARFSKWSESAVTSNHAVTAVFATESQYSDTAGFAINAEHSNYTDSATFADNANEAVVAYTAHVAHLSERSILADTAEMSYTSYHSNTSDTSLFAHYADTSFIARSVITNGVTLTVLEGSDTASVGSVLTRGNAGIVWTTNPQYYVNPSDVAIITTVPVTLPSARWIVSRVAVNYTIVAPDSPIAGQLITVTNGSTANRVTIKNSIWNLDTGLTYQIMPNETRTLYFDGTNWITIQ